MRGRSVTIGCKKCSADIPVDGTEPHSESPSAAPAGSVATASRVTPPVPRPSTPSRTSKLPAEDLDWSANIWSDAPPHLSPVQPAQAAETVWTLLGSDGSNRELGQSDLLAALRAGNVTTADLVWHAGMDDWRPISQVPDLQPYLDSLQEDEPTRNESAAKRF
jgi:hypothetical protein